MNRRADMLFAAILVLLALLAGCELVFWILPANPSVAIFPGLVVAMLLVGAGLILASGIRSNTGIHTTTAPDAMPMAGVVWITAIIAAILVGGFAIGGTLAVFTYLRVHAGCSLRHSAAVTLVANAIPYLMSWLLDRSPPASILGG